MIKYNIVSSYLFLFSLIISILSLPSCSTDDISSGEETKTVPDDEKDSVDNSSFSTTVTISFDNTVTVSNPMADNGVSVQVDNGQVTVVSTAEEIEYILSGTTANGRVKIYSDYKFKLTFNGVSITNPSGPAVNIQSHKRVFVQLNDNTQNILTDGSAYDTNGSEDQKPPSSVKGN